MYSILHLNIQTDHRILKIHNLILNKKPDIICFQEVFKKDAQEIAEKFNYQYVFTPKMLFESDGFPDEEGCAIFSRFPISSKILHHYGENQAGETPYFHVNDVAIINNKRPLASYQAHYILTSVNITLPFSKNITIGTTHFPVVDYQIGESREYHFPETFYLEQHIRIMDYFDRFIGGITKLSTPTIFTADMNQPRDLFLYNALAHTLVDCVPSDLVSSIDPNLHRVKNLDLMVDTIMTSPDIKVKKFEVIEGVSDHKAFFMEFDV
jgi:exonuclease III